MAEIKKKTVAIAGAGDVAKFVVEELLRDGLYEIVIMSRNKPEWFVRPGVKFEVIPEYSESKVLAILDAYEPVVLMSFIGSLGSIYNTTHEILLAACQKSKSCKRLVPSEFGGDIDKCPQLPRFFAKTRGEFREILKSQTEVEWTAVCCGWFMDYFVPANKSYLKEIPGWWPQDIVKWELELRGTGDEAQSFTLARDVAKAIVKLVEIPKWPEHVYVAGHWCTFNDATKILEKHYGHKLTPIPTRTAASIAALIEKHADDEDQTEMISASLDEWMISGGVAVPVEVTERHRKELFPDIHFRTIEEALLDSEKMDII